ncbi:hypothetical protein Slala02_28520 [Streptomyces lavendulae subsp. lavendulae]|nr:hypothetical protein Slala01_31810 [Streptomyces lavendulae subsp. lavendulae]GLX27032.1 hypothetical protein Slala02_28520 [Streptomyces lavendulae subsp. lavendulae]
MRAVADTIHTDGTAVAAKPILDMEHTTPMSREQISAIAHAGHPIKSPLDDDSVSRLLEHGLPRGDERVLDLGCGTAEWLLRALATRPHLHAEGVDVSEAALTRARRAASVLGVAERLVLHRQEAADFTSSPPTAGPPYTATSAPAVSSTPTNGPAGARWPHGPWTTPPIRPPRTCWKRPTPGVRSGCTGTGTASASSAWCCAARRSDRPRVPATAG